VEDAIANEEVKDRRSQQLWVQAFGGTVGHEAPGNPGSESNRSPSF
jgi:hypothetical protein